MKRSGGSIRPITIVTLFLGGLLLSVGLVEAQRRQPAPQISAPGPTAEPTIEDVFNIVVMIKCQVAGDDSIGAGIIFGANTNRLYIATANHVVRRGTEEAANLRVKLRWMPGEWKAAELLDSTNRDSDLAVLAVDLDKERVNVDGLRWDQVGDPGSLKIGVSVYSIGFPHGEEWRTYVTPDRFSRNAGPMILFESSFIGPGNSGGVLLNEKREIVGLIIQFQAPDGRAVSIQNVLDILREWRYAVNLTRKQIRQASQSSIGSKLGAVVSGGTPTQTSQSSQSSAGTGTSAQSPARPTVYVSKSLGTRLEVGTRLPYWDFDNARLELTRTNDADFFFKPNDSSAGATISISPVNGARYYVWADQDRRTSPWGVSKELFTTAVSSLPQHSLVLCITSDGRFCRFSLRIDQNQLFVTWTTYNK